MKRKRGTQLGTTRRRFVKRRKYTRRQAPTHYYGQTQSGELKFLDTNSDDLVVAVGGAVNTGYNLVAQGVGENQRIGRKMTIKSLSMHINVTMPSEQDVADLSTGDVIRLLVFVDKQANGALPAVTDLLETAVYDSFYNLSNTGRFRFLADEIFIFNRQVASTDGTNTGSTPQMEQYIRRHYKLNLPIEFSDTGGVIADVRTNNLAWLSISKNGIGGILTKGRIRFTG